MSLTGTSTLPKVNEVAGDTFWRSFTGLAITFPGVGTSAIRFFVMQDSVRDFGSLSNTALQLAPANLRSNGGSREK
jgi:hypothetical protein